jgi:hypothetical protein
LIDGVEDKVEVWLMERIVLLTRLMKRLMESKLIPSPLFFLEWKMVLQMSPVRVRLVWRVEV